VLTVVLLKSNINATMHARSSICLGWMDVTNLQQVVSYFCYLLTVPQDNSMAKWTVGLICLTLVQASTQTAHCVPLPLITVHQLCMLNTEYLASTVKCKFNSKKCYSVDCCFVLGWWVQCHVLCQQWCCAWWNTESYEACCCTGDTQLGSVNYSFKKFLMGVVFKTHFKQTCMTMLQCQGDDLFYENQQIIRNANEYLHACQMLLKSYNGSNFK